MYNVLRKMISAVIACAMLLGSMPVQAQTAADYARARSFYARFEQAAQEVLAQSYNTKNLPSNREMEALKLLYEKLPTTLREKVFLRDSLGAILLRQDYRILIPYNVNIKDGQGTLYIQEFYTHYDLNASSAAVHKSYAFDVKSRSLSPELINPPAGAKVSVLRGIGIFEGDPIFVEYEDELLRRLHSPSVRQELGFRDLGKFLDNSSDEIVRVFTREKPGDFTPVITLEGKVNFADEFVLKDNGIIDLFDGPKTREKHLKKGSLIDIKKYYKENLNVIKKLLAAVETNIQKRFPKYQGVFFKELLKNDAKYMIAKLEKSAAKKAATKKTGKQVGKMTLRSIGGAFFGIGLYAVLTATTANSVQAAEVAASTPRHEVIKKTVAEIKDAQVRGGVEKLAMFADPNKMPLIVRDAKLLKEMGQYKNILDESGLTEEEAAEMIVDEMVAPLLEQEQAKQTIVKKVKHI